MLRTKNGWARASLHATGTAPNAVPVLKVFDCRKPNQPQIAEIELSDFSGFAQAFAEGEFLHNDNMTRGSKQFVTRVKRVRKALGYSYP